MKVLHVNAHLAGGGVEQYLSQLFPLLHGHGVESLLLHGQGGERASFPAGVALHGVPGIAGTFCPDLGEKLGQVAALIDRERPDVAYLHQVSNVRLLQLLAERLPTVRFVHDFKPVCPEGKKLLQTGTEREVCAFPLGWPCQLRAYRYRCMPRDPRIGIPLIRQGLAAASLLKQSHVVVASHFMERTLVGNGFCQERLHVIPYFTDLPTSTAPPPDGRPPLVLGLGRITREKGFACLLRAFAGLSAEARLAIVGDGPDLADLKGLADRFGVASRVTFTGWLPHDRLDDLYRRCSLVVVPSLWPEPFGIVGIEAMAHGKPVLAFDVGGISEWLEHGKTGFLIQRGDIRALADLMDRLLDHPEEARRLGQAGRAAAEKRFGAQTHGMRLIEILHAAVRHR